MINNIRLISFLAYSLISSNNGINLNDMSKLICPESDQVTRAPYEMPAVDESNQDPSVMRVNSANVLDEGLRIGGRGCRMNSKVKVSQTRRDYACIENKRGTQLAQSLPSRPLLAPIYRWTGFKEPVGFNTNYSVRIRYHLVFRLCLCLGLA
jgi:hypothetical protein